MSIIKNGKKIAGLYKADLITPATDTQAGIIKIATEEEVQGGISNNTAITPYQLANQSPKTLVDDLTIIKDDNNTITTIGVKSKTDTILYDWIGTKSEYNMAYEAGQIKENWICWITDDEVQYINQAVSDIALLDMIVSNHILEGEEKIGKELQGTLILKSIYPNAYNKLLKAYKTATEVTEEIAGISVTYKKCTNKWNIIDISNKSVYDQLFENTGSANFFVIDTDSETFYLPKTNNFFQPTTDANKVNSFTEAGLPNITATLNPITEPVTTGAFKRDSYLDKNGSTASTWDRYAVVFDASASNPIYGKSDTVQPASNNVFIYYKVGTIVVESGEIIDDRVLNNPYSLGESKYSPLDLNNASWLKSLNQWNDGNVYKTFYNEFSQKIGQVFANGFIRLNTDDYTDYDLVINQTDMTFRLPLYDGSENLPSSKYDIAVFENNKTYTADHNGWYICDMGIGQNNLYGYIENQTTNILYRGIFHAGYLLADAYCKKGDIIFTESYGAEILSFQFHYAQGNGSLYFYIGETVENNNLIDTSKLLNTINSIISNNRELIGSYGNPDYSAMVTTSTAPADGYFIVNTMVLQSNTQVYFYINGVAIADIDWVTSNTAVRYGGWMFRCSKGDVFSYTATKTSATPEVQFVPLKGVN